MLRMFKPPKQYTRYSIIEGKMGFIQVDFVQDDLEFYRFGSIVHDHINRGIFENITCNPDLYQRGIERYKYLHSQLTTVEDNLFYNVFRPNEEFLLILDDRRIHLNSIHHRARIRNRQEPYDTFEKFEKLEQMGYEKAAFLHTIKLLTVNDLI